MCSYSGGAYATCISGVYAAIAYEDEITDHIAKSTPIPTKDIADIIVGYYFTMGEYSYAMGHKKDPDEKK